MFNQSSDRVYWQILIWRELSSPCLWETRNPGLQALEPLFVCLAGKGAGVSRGSHSSPGRERKEQDMALCVTPRFCACERHPVTSHQWSASEHWQRQGAQAQLIHNRAGPSRFGSRVLQGRGGEYTWLQRLGVSIISAILQMLRVTRILYFPLLQDVLMNQCGKTTGLNLMVLYINTPYYITLALKMGSEQPSFECIELWIKVVEGYLIVLSHVFRMLRIQATLKSAIQGW